MSWGPDELRGELRRLGVNQHEMLRLLHPERRPIGKDFPNISIGFTDLLEWLNDLPAPQQRPLRKALGKYRLDQATYRRRVAEQLALIQRKKAGRAVMAEVKAAAPMKLAIHPFRPSVDHEVNADSFSPSPVHATAASLLVRDSAGRAVHDAAGDPVVGLGGGTPVIIDYSPDMWGKGGSAHASGPGMQADEVLCHELVHAGRQMKGLESNRALGANAVDKKYENEEEFVAIVVTNIYLSEKKQSKLRGTHDLKEVKDAQGDVVGIKADRLFQAQHFLQNWQGTTLPPSELMEKIRYRQRSLYDALLKIGPTEAAFNPMREWEPQRTRGRIDL
jgi:hypothetical protein